MAAPYYDVGRYACKVTNQALGEARTGTPQFILQFTVLGKVDPSDPSRYLPGTMQYERTHYRAITDKTIKYLLEDLKTLGFKGGSFKELDPGNANFHDFRGQDVDMWCAHENAQDGTPREKWGVARVSSGLEVKAVEPKKLRDLDNLFGKQLKTLAATPGTRSAPVNAAPPSAEISDDDIPF
jgi:hypothetical protein